MSKVMRAQDVVPQAYEEESGSGEGSDSEGEENREEDVVDDLFYDIRNLLAANYSGMLIPTDQDEKEEFLVSQTTRATQLLINRIFSLPTESGGVDVLAILPTQDVITIPRSQRLPEAKIETKWEKFARDKGIVKKKKDRMIYDEHDEEYKPRYGYKRGNNGIMDVPVLEVKKGADPFSDPWEAAAEDKKLRVAKNTKQQLKNQERVAIIRGKKEKQNNRPSSMGDGGAEAGSINPKINPGIPVLGADKRQRGRDGVKNALQLAQFSTASMGRYDEYRKDEPVPKLSGRKRAFTDNMSSSTDDKSRMKSNIRIVEDKVDKKARGVTNSLKAYEGIIPDAPQDSFKQKKGKGKSLNKSLPTGPKKVRK